MSVRFGGIVKAGQLNPDVTPRFAYTAKEAIAAKELIAKDETTGQVILAQSSDETRMPCIGVAVSSASEGQTVYIATPALIRGIARTEDFGQDEAIYVSTVAGKATNTHDETVGNYVQVIGRSVGSADVMVNVDQIKLKIEA